LETKLSSISRLEGKEQVTQFTSLASELVASGSAAQLKLLGAKLLSEDVLVQVAKPVLVHLANDIKSLPEESYYDVAVFLVSSIKQHPSASTFDEADFILRDGLFTHCVTSEEYTEAAQFLAGTNLDSTSRVFTDLEKVDLYIKCAGKCLSATIYCVSVYLSIECYCRGGARGRRSDRRRDLRQQGVCPDKCRGSSGQGFCRRRLWPSSTAIPRDLRQSAGRQPQVRRGGRALLRLVYNHRIQCAIRVCNPYIVHRSHTSAPFDPICNDFSACRSCRRTSSSCWARP
jgi:hypothetical protein